MFYNISIVFLCTIMQAFLSTFLSLLGALGLSHFFYKFNFFGKRFFVLLAPMLAIMPTKLVALCITFFYGSIGSGFTGIVLAHLMLNIPFAFYVINAVYKKFDASLIFLATDAGASGWHCYKDIIFPLLRPTVISFAFLLFLLHFSSFSIPLILGNTLYHHTPEIMISNLYNTGNYVYTFWFWLARLAIIVPFFFAHNAYGVSNIKITSVPNRMPRCYNPFGPDKHSSLWLFFCGIIALITLGPLVTLFYRACNITVFNFFMSLFSGDKDSVLGISVYQVILNSILLGLVSALGSVFIGFLLCVLEYKFKNRWGLTLISLITILSFILSSVGVGIMFAYLASGKLVSHFVTRVFIGVLCHMILNYVFAYKIIKSQMILYHPDLHKSAQSFGANYKQALLTVAVPFVLPALVRAFCVSFGLSLTEVGAGSILQGKMGLTMPMAIRIYRQSGNQEAVIGLSLLLLFLVVLVSSLFSLIIIISTCKKYK